MIGPSDEQCLAHVPTSGDCIFLCVEANANGDLGISHGLNAHCYIAGKRSLKPRFDREQAYSLQMKQMISGTYHTGLNKVFLSIYETL